MPKISWANSASLRFKEHEKDLSAGCRDKMHGIKKNKLDAVIKACQADSGILCKDAGSDSRAVMRCLKEYKDKLTDGCRQSLGSLRPGHKSD